MIFTDDIAGLLAGFLCTHRSPRWMHLRIWSTGGRLLRDGSISSMTFPRVQCFHTCSKFGKGIQTLLPESGRVQSSYVDMLQVLTTFKRSTSCSVLHEPLFLLPVTISKTKTPKLNTSDLMEY
jgi:hypothetical protein